MLDRPQEQSSLSDGTELDCDVFSISFTDNGKLDLPRDFPEFLRALPDLFSEDAVLQIQTRKRHGPVDKLMDAWREAFPPEDSVKEAGSGFRTLELPVTRENMERLAALAVDMRSEDVRLLSVERRLAQDSLEVLLRWEQDGFCVGGDTSKTQRKAFAEKLSIAYRRFERERGPRPRWRLYGLFNVPTLLRETLKLVGPGATVAIGSHEFPTELSGLSGAALEPCAKWDESDYLHIPLTRENVEALDAKFTQEDLSPEFANFDVMREGETLLQCSCGWEITVYIDLPKSRIDAFCRETGMKRLRWWQRPRFCP